MSDDKWAGISEEEVALIWNDMGARPKINGYDFAKVIEEKLKERNAMSNAGMLMTNEEWQAKYTQMSIFYQDRLKYTEDMLAKAMEMNLKLAGMLQDNRAEEKINLYVDPLKQVMPFDGRAAGQKVQGEYCSVCGIRGIKGTVSLCTYKNCPNKKGCNYE